MQTFYSYTSDRVFVRRKYASVWQPWFELYSTAKKPTA
ncbi:tail connector protein [Aeromonas phage Akh-2]|nr:tail connector protein [Aeromonas phage Akh-2]